MKCNIIGAGSLGKNIAQALYAAQLIQSLSLCNRTLESTQRARHAIGFGLAVDKIEHLCAAEITWICCNDDAIQEVVTTLTQHAILKPGSFVIHCSGVLNSTLLAPLKMQGCSVASFHPLKAFKKNYLDSEAFNGVDCVLEGDTDVCDWLKQSFTPLGAKLIAIKPEAKSIYHAAACMASNYLITLASCSEELLLKAGLTPQQSRRMLVNLMQGNLSNLHHPERIAESLTGPLARGDLKTIALHLSSLEHSDSRHLYKTAALTTLPLTQLSDELKEKITALIELN